MQLYLMRHGTASSQSTFVDFDRPLTSMGENEAHLMGTSLGGLVQTPLRILHSPAKRCRQTAETVGLALGLSKDSIQGERGLLSPDPVEVFSALVPAASQTNLLLVGHQPTLENMAAWLLTIHDTGESGPKRPLHKIVHWEPAGCAGFQLDRIPPERHVLLLWMFQVAGLHPLASKVSSLPLKPGTQRDSKRDL